MPAKAFPATRAGILRAALDIVDRLGPAGLTMRRVGVAVNQSPMNLYWRFRSKEELVDRMVDSLFANLPDRLAELGGSEEEQSIEALEILRSTLTGHPRVLPLVVSRSTLGPNALRALAELAKILRPEGAASLLAYTLGVVTIEASAFREALPGNAMPTAACRRRVRAWRRVHPRTPSLPGQTR